MARRRSLTLAEMIADEKGEARTRGRVQGYGQAAATLARDFGQETLARDLITGAGFDVGDFVAAGLGEYDLAPIRQALSWGHQAAA